MIKKYFLFIKEDIESDNISDSDIDKSTSSKFLEMREELKNKILKTIEDSDKNYQDYNSFVVDFLKNSKYPFTKSNVKIDGLIDDSDIFEFYKKWRNDIDEILNDVKFFDDSPKKLNAIGLYRYVIAGTERAIVESLKLK